MRPIGLLALAAGLAAGCGSSSSSSGQATVWITRDRGAQVLGSAHVPTGLTAAQGLERVAKVTTRYGGRYIQSVDGLAEDARNAWFYYVNGYLADRSAAEYRLHTGDVEWWDYRGWRDPAQDPVVVGAFPEPFLHGYAGKRRQAVVAALDPRLGRKVAHLLKARLMLATEPLPREANILFLGCGPGKTRLRARLSRSGAPPGSAVRMVFTGDCRLLLRRPGPFRFRYSVQ